jgi:methylmalonyl-CoA mutase cobalamin-binding domain/chain
MTILQDIEGAVTKCDNDLAMRLVKTAVADTVPVDEIIQDGIIRGMKGVGDLFNSGEYFLPELLVAGQVAQGALDYLEPLLPRDAGAKKRKILMATVKGDIHDLGKNIVIMMLKCNGFDVTDAGIDMAPEEVCDLVGEGDYDILGLSSLLTMTMPMIDETIEAIRARGMRDRIKIIIGGAPVTAEYAEKAGADAFGRDAWDAVVKSTALLET